MNITGAGNRFTVGVFCRVIQTPFQFTHHGFTENVLNLFRIFVHVIRCDVGRVGQIQFPQPVIPHDLSRPLATFRSEINRIPINRSQAVVLQFFTTTQGFV